MNQSELLPHLFRNEFSKLVAVISKLFGLQHIEVAEDIASDTFLLAAETWGKKGVPENPTAWLYAVAKNRTKDYLRRNKVFEEKIVVDVKKTTPDSMEMELDTSSQNIKDSELQMLFALCHPAIPTESQIGLSLRILFGFGIEEIADALLTNKENINKRLFRAKEKLREANIKMELPPESDIEKRLQTVVSVIYLLFNEGYNSASQNTTLRKDICFQALRLAYLLTENAKTNQPFVNALIALICFHASRFDARIDNENMLLMHQQNPDLWDKQLIQTGENYLNKAAKGQNLTKYHLEAAIAYWHTQPTDDRQKWQQILSYYNILLQIEYSPIAALNRTYALSKAENAEKALTEALKLKLETNHLYYALLGHLSAENNKNQSIAYFKKAFDLAKTDNDRKQIAAKIENLS